MSGVVENVFGAFLRVRTLARDLERSAYPLGRWVLKARLSSHEERWSAVNGNFLNLESQSLEGRNHMRSSRDDHPQGEIHKGIIP